MKLSVEVVLNELKRHKSMSVASVGNNYVDNAIVSYAYDDCFRLYFGSYSDTLKCRNIDMNSQVAVTVGNLQIHGIARVIEYNSEEYLKCRQIYDSVYPNFRVMFEYEMNELYVIEPKVIWKYNPRYGAVHRDVMIFDKTYYDSLEPYIEHKYSKRINH